MIEDRLEQVEDGLRDLTRAIYGYSPLDQVGFRTQAVQRADAL